VPTAVACALLLTLASAHGASARTTNVVQLDDGTCGKNLQIGSDRTASSSATPQFLLWGDGGAASYRIFIDGVAIGTFASDGYGNVCIRTTVPLANGAHTLTGNELAPNASYTVTPLSFSVDTVPPATPSAPVMSAYSDSGVAGDHITMYRSVNFTGTSDPNVSVQLYSGPTGLAGAKADATGHWSATTTSLADGTYTVTAAAFDEAGNKSILSPGVTLTVDGTPPVGAITAPAAGSTVSGTVNVIAGASDSVGVAKVAFQVDSVTAATVTAAPYVYAWNTAGVANGSHTLTENTTDLAGNTSTSSITVTVGNGFAATTPGAPTLNPAVAGTGSVALSWSAPASMGNSAITGYRIYRSTASGGETLLTTLGNVTSYTDNGLVPGLTYYYQVTALNSAGEGSRSVERSAVPTASATVPGAPTLNSATGGTNTVTLSWSAPTNSGGAAISGYRIYRSTASGTETLLTTLGTQTSYTDTGLSAGITYYYQVTALNSVGEGSRSAERAATPTAAATTPGAPTLNSATAGTNTVTLAWSAPTNSGGSAITGYRIYRSSTSGTETLLISLGNQTSYTDSGLSPGITYYYQVTALNSVGESVRSSQWSAVPTAGGSATAPGAPGLLGVAPANGSVTISWSAPTSNGGAPITGYRVYRSTYVGGERLYTTVGNVTSFVDTSVVNGISYYYQVTAVNAAGESVRSAEKWATPG
jgi:fibronectin type 3 domain-containing protein